MTVDIDRRRPVLGNGGGGLSGPAIKPLALRLVWQAAQAIQIPVIGCGGITTARDAAEFLFVGASAVQVGTATFTRPFATVQIARDLAQLVASLGATCVTDLVGALARADWRGP
ncbi:Dihydroorotate dehydrogenase, classes 1 and 2 [mine drainage metagenome]|uniref:Dihydroorotate dehydrogenase, classes 1 and 2 n=2 Tax=mine drainage metagenome TaxID=410659 RepID=T1AP24_9ZZZZ